MTLKLTLAAVLPLASLGIATPALADDGYVPDQGWPRPQTEVLLEEYFGRVLANVGEPPVSTVPLPQGIAERFRMSILSSRASPLVITIDQLEHGNTTIRTWSRGDARVLSEAEVAGLREVLAAHDLSRFDFRDDERDRIQPRRREGCLDGYSVYFEQVTAQDRYFSIGRCQLSGDFRAVTQFVLEIAGLAEVMEEL